MKKKTIEGNEVKWSDFENVSDDSSDYGLTEIPFPEKKKEEENILRSYNIIRMFNL